MKSRVVMTMWLILGMAMMLGMATKAHASAKTDADESYEMMLDAYAACNAYTWVTTDDANEVWSRGQLCGLTQQQIYDRIGAYYALVHTMDSNGLCQAQDSRYVSANASNAYGCLMYALAVSYDGNSPMADAFYAMAKSSFDDAASGYDTCEEYRVSIGVWFQQLKDLSQPCDP